MLSVAEKMQLLRKGIFARLAPEDLAVMAERMGVREYANGETIFLQGEPGQEIFLVYSGAVEIVREERVVAVLGPGELIGEMAVLGKGLRSAAGRARGDTRLLFLRDKALRLLIQQIPAIAFAIFEVLVERLENTNELAFFLASQPPERAEVRVTAGDLAGRTFPVYQETTVIGRSLGALLDDAMRLALPSQAPALCLRHARLVVTEDGVYLEPLEGAVAVNGAAIDAAVQIGPEDEVAIGDLRFRCVLREKAKR